MKDNLIYNSEDDWYEPAVGVYVHMKNDDIKKGYYDPAIHYGSIRWRDPDGRSYIGYAKSRTTGKVYNSDNVIRQFPIENTVHYVDVLGADECDDVLIFTIADDSQLKDIEKIYILD